MEVLLENYKGEKSVRAEQGGINIIQTFTDEVKQKKDNDNCQWDNHTNYSDHQDSVVR